MLRICLAIVLALLAIGPAGLPARAEANTVQMVGERLRAGALKPLADELGQRLAAAPGDDQVRFALGTIQFLLTVETMAQSMYRYGLEPPPAVMRNLPFFRFPLPRNPAPERLDYAKMRDVFQVALAGFATADATLAKLGDAEVKLPLAVGLARLDLNGDGTSTEDEALWRVLDATLGGGNIPPEMAERFIISFDRGDAAWLRGYSHLLSALIEFQLAHDWQASFEASFHMMFPRAGLPNAVLNDYQGQPGDWIELGPAADFVAFIHLAHWPVSEPERMTAALHHLESVVALSRESWKFILAESDDEAEWIPSPRQQNAVMPGAAVTQQTVDGWMVFLDEFDAMLQGKKLIPHWRLAKGINLRRVFTEPSAFDPILWFQGSAALPYLEDAPMTTADTWNRLMMLFEGNFLGYAVWFN